MLLKQNGLFVWLYQLMFGESQNNDLIIKSRNQQ